MGVANSSMYDWGSAVGEAGRMAQRVTGKRKILAASNASPERLGVLDTYCFPADTEVLRINYARSGCLDLQDLESKLDETVSAVYIEVPNFLGVVDDSLNQISEMCHSKGALLIVGVNPITLGVLAPPSLVRGRYCRWRRATTWFVSQFWWSSDGNLRN